MREKEKREALLAGPPPLLLSLVAPVLLGRGGATLLLLGWGWPPPPLGFADGGGAVAAGGWKLEVGWSGWGVTIWGRRERGIGILLCRFYKGKKKKTKRRSFRGSPYSSRIQTAPNDIQTFFFQKKKKLSTYPYVPNTYPYSVRVLFKKATRAS